MKYLISYMVVFLLSTNVQQNPSPIVEEQAPNLMASTTPVGLHEHEHSHTLYAHSSKNYATEISWDKDRKLSWSDFTGVPPHDAYYSAISATYIEEEHRCGEDGSFYYDVKSVFVKDLSWTQDHHSEALLHHEQKHFDLTELYARKLRKLFATLENPCRIPMEDLQRIIHQLLNDMEKAHHIYDEMTVHGLNKTQQKVWDDMIANSLLQLDAYKTQDILESRR